MDEISVILPVWNEKQSLAILHRELVKVLAKYEEEILFVDDGSTDGSSEEVKKIMVTDKRVRLISLRQHVGKSVALNRGFREAKGSIIITLDSDLQDRPEDIPQMLKELEKGYDMIVGWKQNRQDPWEKKFMSRIFNWWMRTVSGLKIHDIDCGLKVFRREVVDEIELYGQLHRFFPVLAAQKGFKIGEVPVLHQARKYGKSKYGIGRIFAGLMDFTTVYFLAYFSDRPLHLFGGLGLAVTGVGIVLGGYLSALHFQGYKIGDRPMLILAVLLIIAGIQLLSTGLMAELIISKESKVGHDQKLR